MSEPDAKAATAVNRRWFRFAFSLRALFVVVTVAGICLGWLAYELNWIRQRHALMAKQEALAAEVEPEQDVNGFLLFTDLSAPGLLWIFGEEPLGYLEVIFIGDKQRALTHQELREVEQAKRLFPEANVTWRIVRMSGQ
jgi:hypothetical protein